MSPAPLWGCSARAHWRWSGCFAQLGDGCAAAVTPTFARVTDDISPMAARVTGDRVEISRRGSFNLIVAC